MNDNLMMLFYRIQGIWIPVLTDSMDLPLPIHVIVHKNRMGNMTEEEWILAYARLNACNPEDLQFRSLSCSNVG